MRGSPLFPRQGVDAIVERGAIDAEQAGRLAHVVVRDLLRGLDVGFFPHVQRGIEIEVLVTLNVVQRNGHQVRAVGCGRSRNAISRVEFTARIQLGFEIIDPDLHAGVFCGQAYCDVAQFAYVARKWVGQQASRCRLTQSELRQIRLGRIQAAEMFQQEDAVIAQIAQRRNGNGKNRKAVVEIGAKATLADFLFQVAIGRGDDASR